MDCAQNAKRARKRTRSNSGVGIDNGRITCARENVHCPKNSRYLSWLGSKTRVFNVGNYRRELSGASVPHQFFDPSNKVGLAARRKAAEAALQDMVQWFNHGGEVGVFDATNSTTERRKWLLRKFDEAGVEVAMIESLCDDNRLSMQIYRVPSWDLQIMLVGIGPQLRISISDRALCKGVPTVKGRKCS